MTNNPNKKKKTKLIIAAIIAGSLLLLLLVGILAYSIWSKPPETADNGLKQQVTSSPEAIDVTISPAATPSATATPVPSVEPTEPPSLRKDDVYTLLVVGRDRIGSNTDTIMVVQMDCHNRAVNVVSIPRDTLVNVPWAVKKANSIYGTLGIDGLVSGIEDLIGFNIDNYIIINTYVFQAVIDCIGGVYYSVPFYMFYDDPDQNLHIALSPGYQLLDGNKAEQLVRFRQNNDGSGYGTGDLGRIELQHDFFLQLAKQVLSLGNISNLTQLIDIVLSNTETDLTSGNLAFFAEEFFKINEENISFLTMPTHNVYIMGGSYVSVLLDEWLEMINTYLNPYTVDVTTENVNILMFDDSGFSVTAGEAPGFGSFYNYAAVG